MRKWTYLRFFLSWLLIVSVGVPAGSDTASSAYNRGVHAESHLQWDAAFEAYKQAYSLKPKDARYATSYLRARTTAAVQHVDAGQKLLQSNKLEEAFAEFQRGADIDPTNYVAADQERKVLLLLKRRAAGAVAIAAPGPDAELEKQAERVEGPIELAPSPDAPITLRMTTTADNVYKTIGKLGGINVLFDLDYKPQRITIELNDVTIQDALKMVSLESKTFWRPISSTAIFVAAETKRKELETNVMKTFYLENASNPADIQEVVGTLKSMLDVSRVQVNASHSSITVRGTVDQMVMAQKLISAWDKPKSEVVIDIDVLQVSRDRMHNIGTTVPTSATVGPLTAAGSGIVQVGSLYGTALGTSIPSATFTALMSSSDTKVLQSPEIRAMNDGKATLRIGDRYPVATGSYSSGIGGGSVSPLVNTQFQYIDVGVNIDITPHIHSDNEVTLKMSLEISTVTGTENIGGISQPIIGQRRIEHETRLHDGEVNLVGGILDDTETTSLSGYPLLARIPILGALFAQTNKDHQEDEVVFAITPHIVRADNVTDENLRMVDVGSGTSIGLRYKEDKKPAATDTPDNGQAPQAQAPQTPSQPARSAQPTTPATPAQRPSVPPQPAR
jgi:general secretion pathway protein D